MEDARHIENLIYQYAAHIDAGELEQLAALFSNAAVISNTYDTRQEGYDAVLSMYKNSTRIYPETGTPCTKHLTTNVMVDVDPDGQHASARSYYMVFQAAPTATPPLPLQPIISGRYADTFRKRDDQWEFSEREIFIDLIGDLSAHLLYELKS